MELSWVIAIIAVALGAIGWLVKERFVVEKRMRQMVEIQESLSEMSMLLHIQMIASQDGEFPDWMNGTVAIDGKPLRSLNSQE